MVGGLGGVQVQGCAEGRMSGKRQFLRDGEYADFFSFSGLNSWITR